MLTIWTLSALLGPVVNLCFRLGDQDKKGLRTKISTREERRVRRRLNSKQPEGAGGQAGKEVDPHVALLPKFASRAITRMWNQLLGESSDAQETFRVALAFWPRNVPSSERNSTLVEHIFRTISAVKWRVLQRNGVPPFCFASDALHSSNTSEHFQSFLGMQRCCLDPHWSEPARDHITSLHPDAQEAEFLKLVRNYFSSFRPVSLREEQAHTTQRSFAGGCSAKARIVPSQVAKTLVHTLKCNYTARGGRDLTAAAPRVLAAFQRSRVRKSNGKSSRPRQFGNPLFFWMAQMREQGNRETKQELVAKWHRMPQATKAWWKNKQQIQVRIRRSQERAVAEFAAARKEAEAANANLTPWRLGDAEWPIQKELLDNFLETFRDSSRGISQLKDLARASESSASRAAN